MNEREQWMLPEDPGSEEYIEATYLLRTSDTNVGKLCTTMAAEQTTGTWVKVPGGQPEMLERHEGKVLSIWEIPDIENEAACDKTLRAFVVQIAYPWSNFGGQLPMLLTTVFGNISMMTDLKLLDLRFPQKLVGLLPGPRFGVRGIRKQLGVLERPLLNTMIKPSTGITPEQGAELLYQAALGGTDIIKDDEVLSETEFSPALRRVELYMKSLRRAESETGEKKLYAVNITDESERAMRRARAAVEAGANALMINFLTAGFGLVSSLARNSDINLPILAHLDFGGALYASPWHGISSTLLYGKLARLAGIDLLTIPTPYGKFALSHGKYLRMVMSLRAPFYSTNATFPVIGGAIKPGHLPMLFEDAGTDFVVGAGGAIYGHPMGSEAGARAFRQGIDLLMQKGSLEVVGNDHPELQKAIEMWGASVEK
jgi:2,3-diketo-5-methylthiopentyl-1-phosphate enolase